MSKREAAQRLDSLPLQRLVHLVDASPIQEHVVPPHDAGRQHVGAEEQDKVEGQRTTECAVDSKMLQEQSVHGRQRQSPKGSGNAQRSGRHDSAEQGAEEVEVHAQRHPLFDSTHTPIV